MVAACLDGLKRLVWSWEWPSKKSGIAAVVLASLLSASWKSTAQQRSSLQTGRDPSATLRTTGCYGPGSKSAAARNNNQPCHPERASRIKRALSNTVELSAKPSSPFSINQGQLMELWFSGWESALSEWNELRERWKSQVHGTDRKGAAWLCHTRQRDPSSLRSVGM